MAITNGFPKDEKQVVDSALSTTSKNPVQNAIVTQNLNNKANTSSVLTKTNTTAFTPTADYHPATKAYVDSKASSGSDKKLILSVDSQNIDEDTPLQLIAKMDCTKSYLIEFDYLYDTYYCNYPVLKFQGNQSVLSVSTIAESSSALNSGSTYIEFGEAHAGYGYFHTSIEFIKGGYDGNSSGGGSTDYRGYSIKGYILRMFDEYFNVDIVGSIYRSQAASYSTAITFSTVCSLVNSTGDGTDTVKARNIRVYEIA